MLISGVYRFPTPGKGRNRFRGNSHHAPEAFVPEDGTHGDLAFGRSEHKEDQFRESVMGWIEQQATEAWAPGEDGARAVASFDFLTVRIGPVPVPSYPETGEIGSRTQWTRATQSSHSASAGPSWRRRNYKGHTNKLEPVSSDGVPQQ